MRRRLFPSILLPMDYCRGNTHFPSSPEKDGDIQAALTIHQLDSETDGLTFLAMKPATTTSSSWESCTATTKFPHFSERFWSLLGKLGYRHIGRSQPMGSSSARVRPR